MNVATSSSPSLSSISYGFHCDLDEKDFGRGVTRVTEALKSEGFGILTEIDVQATMKAKLGVEGRPYRILGACNPGFAHEALQLDPMSALVLPCNVVLEPDGDDRTRIRIVDPRDLVPDPEFAELAGAAAVQLTAALDALTT